MVFKFLPVVVLLHLGFVTTARGEVDLEPVFDIENVRILDLRVSNTLKCRIVGDDDDDQNMRISWRRHGKKVTDLNTDDDPTKFEIIDNNLVIRRTVEDDIVPYTCEIIPEGGHKIIKEILTLSKPIAKITASAVFVEGQKLKLECTAHGRPPPEISWRVNNDTYDESTERIHLINNAMKQKNGILEIESAELNDRGDYFCIVANDATSFLNSTVEIQAYVRVKDKLAAVWPFIGICAEVIILCSIIFAYEKNRSKVDLDESDTDAGADKGGDSGKDSVRQRK